MTRLQELRPNKKTKFWEVYERFKFVKIWRLGETRVQM